MYTYKVVLMYDKLNG